MVISGVGNIDILVIVIYILGLIVVGIYAAKRVKTGRDYTSAGKNLSWKMVAGSTIATCMGSNMVMGKYDMIFESGVSGMTAVWFYWAGWIFLLLMVKKLRTSEANSIPDFLAKKFNAKSRKICSLCVLITAVASCAAQFLTIGTILNSFGVCSVAAGTWIGALVIVFFTIFSGLWGVAMTDTVQSIMLLVIFGVIFPIAVFRVAGGWGAVAEFNGSERMSLFAGMAPVSMLGWTITNTLSAGADPTYAQRIFSSKSTKDALIGSGLGWLCTLIVAGIVSALPGLAIQKIFPDLAAGSQFTPLFIMNYFPVVLRGVALAGLFGLILTSADSYLLMLSSTVTDDVIKPRIENLSDKNMLKLNRITCVGAAFIICAMALYVNKIYALFKIGSGAYGAGVFFPLFLGCFWKKANARACNLAMVLGSGVSFIFDMFLKVPLGLNMDGCIIGAAICAAVCVLGSLAADRVMREK